MDVIIATLEGYTIGYDPRGKEFYLKDSEGEVVGQGKTQEDVEEQAKKLSKSGFKPIAAFRKGLLELNGGRVTSLNMADNSVRFSADGKSSVKVSLRYDRGLFELTAHNELIKHKVDALLVESHKTEEQIKELLNQLDKPISLEYFGLPFER